MEHRDEQWRFGGFSSPNFTSVPDEFFDELVPRLGNAELRVLLYIIRRTFGFKKQVDAISLSQMVDGIVRKDGTRLDAGTGLKKAAVCRALASLEKSGIIIRKKQYATTGGAIASSYQLHMQGAQAARTTGGGTPVYAERQGVETPCLRGETGSVHAARQPLSTQRDTQYTVTNKQLDKNVNVPKKAEKTNYLYLLPDVHSKDAHVALIADDILAALGDQQSAAFYRLVARKVPEAEIRKSLSELKGSKARSKAKVFTRNMLRYAEAEVDKEFADRTATLVEGRETLLKRLKFE
jgi:hypothetical protein